MNLNGEKRLALTFPVTVHTPFHEAARSLNPAACAESVEAFFAASKGSALLTTRGPNAEGDEQKVL